MDIVDLDAASAITGPIDAGGKDEPDTTTPQLEIKKPDPIVVSPAKKSGSKKGKKEKEKKEKEKKEKEKKEKGKGEAGITMDCLSRALNASMHVEILLLRASMEYMHAYMDGCLIVC